jgi:hypothetical protein
MNERMMFPPFGRFCRDYQDRVFENFLLVRSPPAYVIWRANAEWNQKFDNCKNLPGK